ncbi:D-alanyl-D-alanine carboxypeptidase/D-alanyl-D-alanine endopeptidase [Gallaecimonas mangrovi]|uniref:D-alanyl-D-alanine carboxypeptidase/D-alanyl-D-alanine endopeptidase n=1 Tax=Gallaecimonas mangrovi TaxID=2291597 RepID=UPI000E1FF75E|nr:D-alanyl-D-alanine carboxypeptidase/D-alanyl-D-alanine-endopeptidase [Gallaecimonas mangrovi]
MRYCLSFILLLFSFSSVGATWQSIINHRPAGSQVALIVEPLDKGHLSIEHNSQLLLAPASTQKLFTSLAAELELGDNYRFDTRIDGRGQLHAGQWQGDLRLVFSGAPDFNRAQLGALLQALKGQGIHTIDGDILLDGSAFAGYERGPGWPWDNLGVCYSAPSSALTFEHNCVAASLSVGAAGQKTRFYVPSFQPVSVTDDVVAVTQDQQQQNLCELQLDRGPGNHYHLHGCVTNERAVWPLNFAVNDTAAYIAAAIKNELKRYNIHFAGDIRRQDNASGQWQRLAVTHSAPLSALIEHMLTESDNLYANNLGKTLGRKTGLPGTFALGVREVKDILAKKIGLTLKPATLVDGSGLSRDNLVSPAELAAVLKYLGHHTELATYKGLPLAGKTGTLKYRHSVMKAPLRGNLKAKTGTLNGSMNLAGFFTAASGQRYLFVLMSSSLSLGDNSDQADRTMTEFERKLLDSLYHAG